MLTSAFSGPRNACALLLLDSFCSERYRAKVTSTLHMHTCPGDLVDVVDDSGDVFKGIVEEVKPGEIKTKIIIYFIEWLYKYM